MQRLDERGGIAGEQGNGRGEGCENCKRVALGGCSWNRVWKVMRFIREIGRFLEKRPVSDLSKFCHSNI